MPIYFSSETHQKACSVYRSHSPNTIRDNIMKSLINLCLAPCLNQKMHSHMYVLVRTELFMFYNRSELKNLNFFGAEILKYL